MWYGYEDALVVYRNSVIREFIVRGHVNNMILEPENPDWECPWWVGDPRLHESHRSVLLRKAPTFYSRYGWVIGDEFAQPHYLWPHGKDSVGVYTIMGGHVSSL
jgi:hypothetical protein